MGADWRPYGTAVHGRVTSFLSRPIRSNATATMISLAARELSEQSVARWILDNWPPTVSRMRGKVGDAFVAPAHFNSSGSSIIVS